MQVSVVVPVLNEADSIRPLLRALASQTRPADEIVVADGGSTDGTGRILAEAAAALPQLRVVAGPGGRSENRNAAIAAATHDVIACVDAGCVPDREWLERLTAPLAAGADWVGGFYRPHGRSPMSTTAGVLMTMVREEVDPDHYVPSGASQAFHKAVWHAAGGFPEGMIAAEDTVFGERAQAAGYRAQFVPEAVVTWQPPPGLVAMVAKAFTWGRADGRARVRGATYKRLLAVYWGVPLVSATAGHIVSRRSGVGAGMVVAAAGLAPLGAVVARRTRYKYRWVPGPASAAIVPAGHVLQVMAQSAGFVVGILEA